ncbi:ATPase PAAT [Pelodytes ibericus]
MSGPMSSVLGGCSPTPVTCSSTWQSENELGSVLNVSYSEYSDQKAKNTTRECCVCLEPAPACEARSPCSLLLCCVAQGKDRILSLSVCSQARTIEVYSLSSDGQEEEYLGTSRGERSLTIASRCEDDSPIILYKTYLKLDFPALSCKVKLLSLGGKQNVFLSEISVQLISVPERCVQAPSVMGSSVNLDRVQSIMDSMGGKLSPGAEQLMSMVRAQQKHQIPFGAHLLQLFGSVERGLGREQLNVESGSHVQSAFKVPNSQHETSHNQELHRPMEPHSSSQCIVLPNKDLNTTVTSLLQNQTSGAAGAWSPDALLPFLHTLGIGKNQCLPEQGADRHKCQKSREEESETSLEKLVSIQIDRMEKTLMQHIDQKMKRLQDHLDARLDLLISVVQNSNSAYPGKAGMTYVNGQHDHSEKQNEDYTALSKHHLSDTSAMS